MNLLDSVGLAQVVCDRRFGVYKRLRIAIRMDRFATLIGLGRYNFHRLIAQMTCESLTNHDDTSYNSRGKIGQKKYRDGWERPSRLRGVCT